MLPFPSDLRTLQIQKKYSRSLPLQSRVSNRHSRSLHHRCRRNDCHSLIEGIRRWTKVGRKDMEVVYGEEEGRRQGSVGTFRSGIQI